jgi:site-specific recombinase
MNTNWNKKYRALRYFIKEVKLSYRKHPAAFNNELTSLLQKKLKDDAFTIELNTFFYDVLENAQFVTAFTDYGINTNLGFVKEITSRLKHKILPPVFDENELGNYIKAVFPNEKNLDWLCQINIPNWELLFSAIDKTDIRIHEKNFAWQMVRSIVVLTNRLVNIGLDPYFAQKLPPDKDHHNCFLEFNLRINEFVDKYQNEPDLSINKKEVQELLTSLSKCEELFLYLRNNKDVLGISLHLTFILERANQHIVRLKLLLSIYINEDEAGQTVLITTLIKILVIAEFERYSISKFFKQNSNLLAYRIVSHTSEKGGNYIGFNKAENRKLFVSAMGGGLVVVFLVFIKNFIHHIPNLSLFGEGLLFGLNYSFGFILMHLWHLTLATKQPAMTASFIAKSIEDTGQDKKGLSLVLAQILRSQFISLAGNLLVVLPVCFLIAWSFDKYLFTKIFNYSVAETQLTANHPFYSGALIYAAITGIYLSLSGLITGYYDNKIVFSEIPNRIRHHSKLQRMLKPKRLEKLSLFVEKNTGAIIGNLFLGMALGGTGNFSKFIGLPIDIRHITISAGNFGIALGSIEHYNLAFVITVFFGIMAIGVINIAVSFLISFYVACRSRSVTHLQTLKILKELFIDVFKKPAIILKPEK